jgi:hypothetical protein
LEQAPSENASKRSIVFIAIAVGSAILVVVAAYLLVAKFLKDRARMMAMASRAQWSNPIQAPPSGPTTRHYTAKDLEEMRKQGKNPYQNSQTPYIPPQPQANPDAAIQRTMQSIEEINRINQMNQRLMEQQQRLQKQQKQ